MLQNACQQIILASFYPAWSGSKLFEKVISISQKLPLGRRELTSLMLPCKSIVGRVKFYYFVGVQWLSGRVLDSRPKGCGFEPHLRHCLVSLSKNINPSLVLVQPRKTRPFITERLLMGRKESNYYFVSFNQWKVMKTIQSLYNTPCYNTNMDITRSCSGSHFFAMEFNKGILWSFSYNSFVKLSLYNMITYNRVHSYGLHCMLRKNWSVSFSLFVYGTIHQKLKVLKIPENTGHWKTTKNFLQRRSSQCCVFWQ